MNERTLFLGQTIPRPSGPDHFLWRPSSEVAVPVRYFQGLVLLGGEMHRVEDRRLARLVEVGMDLRGAFYAVEEDNAGSSAMQCLATLSGEVRRRRAVSVAIEVCGVARSLLKRAWADRLLVKAMGSLVFDPEVVRITRSGQVVVQSLLLHRVGWWGARGSVCLDRGVLAHGGAFAAPELLSGKDAGSSCLVYSLGAMLCALLDEAGDQGVWDRARIERVCKAQPVPLRDILERAMHTEDPGVRHNTPSALAASLAAWREGERVSPELQATNEVLSRLREQIFSGDLHAVVGVLDSRADLASQPVVRRYVWDHIGARITAPLASGRPLDSLMRRLLDAIQPKGAVAVCPQRWDEMDPQGGEPLEGARRCHLCDRRVVRAGDAAELERLMGSECVFYDPDDPEEIAMEVLGYDKVIGLGVGQARFVGSSPQADIRFRGLAPWHAKILGLEGGRVRLVPLDGEVIELDGRRLPQTPRQRRRQRVGAEGALLALDAPGALCMGDVVLASAPLLGTFQWSVWDASAFFAEDRPAPRPGHSPEGVVADFEVTRERIRPISSSALRNLRNRPRADPCE